MHPLLFSLGKPLSVEVSMATPGEAKVLTTESYRARFNNNNPHCAFLQKLMI